MKDKQNAARKLPISTLLDSEKWSKISVPLMSILLSLILSSLILLILGKNPFTAYASFLSGSGFLPKQGYGKGSGMLSDFFSFLNYLAPMILAALGFVISFKAGLFNIGISGQMLLSGFLAAVIVGYSGLNAYIAKPLVILVGIIAGGAAGAFVGFLKYKFNIHEVVSTIMINYIISYLTGFFINGFYADPVTRCMRVSSDAARLTWLSVPIAGLKCDIPLGIFIAIAAAFIVKFIFEKTVFGFELRAVGSNIKCAQYSGMKVGNRIIVSLMLSGMLAGLAGVTYYCGYFNTILPKSLTSMGYDAIAVALLGNSGPIGAIFASILVSIFQFGSNYMSSSLGVAKEIASLITGILLLFAACGGYFKFLAHQRLEKAAVEAGSVQKAEAHIDTKPVEKEESNNG